MASVAVSARRSANRPAGATKAATPKAASTRTAPLVDVAKLRGEHAELQRFVGWIMDNHRELVPEAHRMALPLPKLPPPNRPSKAAEDVRAYRLATLGRTVGQLRRLEDAMETAHADGAGLSKSEHWAWAKTGHLIENAVSELLGLIILLGGAQPAEEKTEK
jgi:hypothetical protein